MSHVQYRNHSSFAFTKFATEYSGEGKWNKCCRSSMAAAFLIEIFLILAKEYNFGNTILGTFPAHRSSQRDHELPSNTVAMTTPLKLSKRLRISFHQNNHFWTWPKSLPLGQYFSQTKCTQEMSDLLKNIRRNFISRASFCAPSLKTPNPPSSFGKHTMSYATLDGFLSLISH